jgi:hypothetical protein
VLRRLDALEFPEILGLKVLGFWVSSAEALRNPSVVEALSITESQEADEATRNGTEEQAREGEENVGIEGYGVEAGLPGEVPAAESCTSDRSSEPCVAAQNLVGLGDIRDGNVINVGVMLDKIN